MSRCPNLDYAYIMIGIGADLSYRCKLSGQIFESYDPKVKCVCYAEYGDEYKQCSIYQDKAKNFRD